MVNLMAKSGPKPKATTLKEANGSFIRHPERRNKNEPQPAKGHPEKKPAVAADKTLSAIWDRLAVEMDEMRILTRSDGCLLELCSVTYKELHKLRAMIAKEGWTIKGRHGHPVRHPMVPTYANLKDSWRRLICEMGFTPSSRVSLHASVDDGEPDPFLAFLEMSKKQNDSIES